MKSLPREMAAVFLATLAATVAGGALAVLFLNLN